MATYYDDNGNEITYEQWKANKDKKEQEAKANEDVSSEKSNTPNRKYAKRLWEGFRKTGDISDTVDFEKFYNALDNDYATKLFYGGRQRGGITTDFETFRDALLGTPKVEVDGVDVMGPNGLRINQEDVIAPDFDVTSYENDLENITNKVNELKYRPILYTEETAPDPSQIGEIDVKATNEAIREIQSSAPDLLVTNDKIDVGGVGSNPIDIFLPLDEAERRRYGEILTEMRRNKNIVEDYEGDQLAPIDDDAEAFKNKSYEEQRKIIYDKIIEERSQKLEQYNNGELDLSPEELYTISKINPKVESYLQDKLPDFNNLKTREDLQNAYSKTVNDALKLDPRFANITADIKNNINELSNDQWTEIGEKYDIFDEKGFKLAQEEYARWYNEQFQTRLNSNKKASDLFDAYGVGAARNFEKMSRNFERQLIDSEQEDKLRPDWISKYNPIGMGIDLWDDLWSTRTASKLYEMAGFDPENQKQSVKDFDFFESGFDGLLSQAQTGLGFILEAGDKLPDSVSSNINKVQVAFGKKELERRADVVDNLEKLITSGKLNKDMTLGEARKLDASLNERLAWHDWTWTDSDNLSEYLTRKQKRENISEESIAFDLEEMAKANAELTKYTNIDTGASIINPRGNNNLLGLMEALSMGIDQAPHMIPSVLGTTALAASGVSLFGSGGTSAPGSIPLAAAGVSLIALGAGYQGAMSYGNIFMDGVERQMEDKYGKNGFTTSQYIEALKDETIGDEGSAVLGGLAVTGAEFASDIVLSQIGGGISKALGPTTKKMFSNTLGNYLMTAKLPQAFFNMKAQAGKEFLTEGFQSYLEQGFTNLAAGVNDPNTTFQTAFTENIDFDQIMTEAWAGWKMGHIFALAGGGGKSGNSNLGVNLDQGNSIDSYIGQAKKLVDNLNFDSGSPTFRLKDKMLQDLINGAKENKKLTPEQIRLVEVQISNMRQNALDVPSKASVSQRTDLNSLLDEQKRLKNYIKKINNKSLTEYEVSREIEVDNEIKDIMRYITPESFKPNKPSGGAAGAAMLEKNIADNRATIQKSSNNKLTFKDFTNQAAMDAYGESKGLEITYSGEQGTILQNLKTGEQEILINRDVSNKTGGTNVASHELGHAMVFETLRNNPEADAAFGQAVDRTLNDISKVDPMQLAESEYKQRLLRYNKDELSGQEKMMLLGDALKNKDITIDPGVLQKIRNFVNKTLQDLGIQKISFNRDADVIAFLENLSDSIEKNKLNQAQETMLADGAEVNLANEVDADVSAAQQIALASKASLNNIDELATQYQNDPGSADIETLVKQYRNLALKALGYDIAKGDVRAEEAVSFVDKEFDSILRRWDPSKGKLSTHITANISPKRQAFYESQIGKKAKTTSIDDERAQQVADVEETVEFDEKEKQDTGRQKIYSSETNQIQDQDVSETKALIKDELKKDILLAINKGENVADVVSTIKNNAKRSYFKQLRKDIGTFSSDKYKAFVNSLDAKFIKSLPIAAIKRRFGKLFSIKQIGTTPTKQISKTGKPSYFNKPIYNVPKINSEGLQNFKDYFLGGEKRQQSLYNLLASDFALESINELMNDTDFMSKLQTALGDDGITAQEFMQSIENKLDPRAVEDKSLDVIQQAAKSKLQDLTKSNVTVKSPVKKAANNETVVVKEKTKSKKISEETISNAFNEKGAEGINTLIDAFDPSFKKLNAKDKLARKKVMLESLIKNGMPLKDLLKAANLSPGYSYKQLINRGLQWISDKVVLEQKVKDRPETSIPQTLEAYLRGEIGDIKAFKLEMQKKYGETTDSDIKAALQGRAIGEKGIKSRAEADVANYEAIVRGREKILNIVRKLNPSDKAAFIDFLYSNSNLNQNLGRVLSPIFGFQKLYNPLKYAINKKGNKYVTNPIINEHVLQFNEQVKMIASLLDAPLKIYKDGLKYLDKNQFQVPIQGVAQEQTYTTIDGGKWPAKSKLHKRLSDAWESFLRGEIEWTQIPDGIIRYFNEYFYLNPNNVSFRNPINNKIETAAKIYNAEIKGNIKVDGKTFTAKQLMSMNSEGKAMFPNVEQLQARAVDLAASKILNPSEVQDFINANLPAAVAMNEANFVIQENIPGLFEKICSSPCRIPQPSNKIKKTLENSLDTRVNAETINKKRKGISVFDFDDTLATTKSEVIVNMPDGTTNKIDAAEFAAQSVNLEKAGAKFDFSEFNEVIGGKKGPLADLALKRQNKFGSGDIFVLTARPQISAQGIKTFLDGIGLNLPIENITGLENGSPQAKADWILDKTAQGYNDFYFADDAKPNVDAVQQILDTVDVKSKTQIALASKAADLNKEFNKQIEEVTGKESFKEYSNTRAKLEGKQQDKGVLNFIKKQLTITPSAEDFMGLMYDLMGKGAQGNKHAKFVLDNLMKPFNKAEQEVLSAKVTVANDFSALRDKFPSLKSKNFSNPLMESIDVGPYTKSHGVRVYIWNKQGMDIPGLSQRDQNALVKAVEANSELQAFADNVILIQKDSQYPPPSNNWSGGNITSDILSGLDKGFRRKSMTTFNENVDIIFSPENMNKLEALFGTKWTEALKDSLRRMKAGSNRPVYQGGGSRVVNNLLDWLNGSVGAIMFLNMRSGLLQLTSAVNFINWGDNNMYAAAKAFANQPQYWKDVVKLMNSDYLVNRRDGLKINVNEAELANAAKKGGMKGALAYLLDKGFVITRIMDTLAIASGGASFYRNRINALLKRQNPKTGNTYTQVEAEAKAFDDFYAIAEESQQSSNPSKISQQQASLAGRVILSFQNVTMQYNRKMKKAIRNLYNRRTNPGQTQRESDLGNLSQIIYYSTVQNIVFHSLQQALFAGLFKGEDEEEKDKTASIANGMLDSLLFGLGFGGAAISTVKNVVLELAKQGQKKAPKYEDAVFNVFDFSPVLDSKVRKLKSAFKSFSWNMKEMKRRGWSLENPAYLAVSQVIAAFTNLPMDRVMRKYQNLSTAIDEETQTWQRIALALGWDTWSLGLPYWGLQSTLDKEEEEDAKIKADFKADIRKLKADGYKKTMTPEKFDDVVEVKSPYGTVMYYYKIIKK